MSPKCLLSRFRRDQRGTTAVIFGVAAIPLFIAIGAGIDFARAANYRVSLQMGVDAAALALAKMPSTATDAELSSRARAIFDSVVKPDNSYATTSFSATRANRVITVQARGNVDLAFGGVLGKPSVDINSRAQARSGKLKIELALALDNTGSMASSNKLVELKRAVINLLDRMQALNDVEPGAVKVALVPFATQVKPGRGYVDAPWLRYNDNGAPGTRAQKDAWVGCVTDRDQPSNTLDTQPIGHYSLQHPVADRWQSECRVLQTLMPLTADLRSAGPGSLRAAVANMNAVGTTNVSIGVAWGLKTLMNRQPFSGAAPAGDEDVLKALIVLTDGDNTRDRWSDQQWSINPRTRATCDTVKNAVRNANPSAKSSSYIQLYTIRVIEGNESLLRDCAGNGGTYSNVNQASELNRVFETILDQITRVRLTS